ncbi:hypothetical protein SDC9_193808 [bioreactor metagenome]|uniref:Uncharacterized protein n=1 Tax=bioreactor metagenome TaxID=1076179 RepID=A0A645I4I9_9ZZZZ
MGTQPAPQQYVPGHADNPAGGDKGEKVGVRRGVGKQRQHDQVEADGSQRNRDQEPVLKGAQAFVFRENGLAENESLQRGSVRGEHECEKPTALSVARSAGRAGVSPPDRR